MHAETRAIWDLPERGSRGPRPRHDRAAIARAAIEIADRDGPDALTMRRVADALGIATMSLYNYVPTKDHLVELVIDQLTGEYAYPAAPPADRAGKRAGIAELARQVRDVARRHPWLPVLLHRPSVPGPNGLRYMDYFLGLLDDSGLDTGVRLEMIALISGFATSYGAMQAGAGGGAGEPVSAQVQALVRGAASGNYPSLAAALSEAGPVRGAEDIFGSCIARLVDVARPADRAGSAS